MSEPFLGEIRMVGFNYQPRGWAFCDGRLLSIQQNSALFALLGTQFGGNGTTNFGLPDLRGRVPVSQGQGPGLSNYVMGEMTGSETVTLINSEMPMHTHLLNVAGAGLTGNQPLPTNNFLAQSTDNSTGSEITTYSATANSTMNPNAINIAGGNQPHNNLQPLTCVNFIIALEGIFPSRN